MYLVALFFSIFICSAIFYAANPKKSMGSKTAGISQQASTGTGNQVLLTVTRQ